MISDGCPLIAFLCLAAALLTTGASLSVANHQGCPEGWTPFGPRCFQFFHSTATWIEAQQSCQTHAANLASIHSAEENQFIVELIKKATRGFQVTWIGGHDKVRESQWMWSDGSDWDYPNWHAGQPDNHSWKEHFAVINWGATLWNDYIESMSLPYICATAGPGDKGLALIMGGLKYKCTLGMQ